MNKQDFLFACHPELKQVKVEVDNAKQSLNEISFQLWAKQFDKLPEAVLRELYHGQALDVVE